MNSGIYEAAFEVSLKQILGLKKFLNSSKNGIAAAAQKYTYINTTDDCVAVGLLILFLRSNHVAPVTKPYEILANC